MAINLIMAGDHVAVMSDGLFLDTYKITPSFPAKLKRDIKKWGWKISNWQSWQWMTDDDMLPYHAND